MKGIAIVRERISIKPKVPNRDKGFANNDNKKATMGIKAREEYKYFSLRVNLSRNFSPR